MTNELFLNTLKLAGYEPNTWLRPVELKEIIVDNDSAHAYNANYSKVKFDTTNNLILIKNAILIPQSGLLSQPKFNTSSSIVVGTSIYKNRGRLRTPKANDYVFIIDIKTNKRLEMSKIKSVENYNNSNAVLITLVDDNLYKAALKSKTVITMHVLLSDYEEFTIPFYDHQEAIFYEKEITNSEADLIISVSKLVGFEYTITPLNYNNNSK